MRVAVLSLTRDRIDYTRHCFETLRQNAGCEFDHFVLDQGSTDGTTEWLDEEFGAERLRSVQFEPTNIGVNRGMNALLDTVRLCGDYDVITKIDNDCEVLTPSTLRDVCALAVRWDAILSPRILGLRSPPPTIGRLEDETAAVDLTQLIGGIFMAVPAHVFTVEKYRHDESGPVWGHDDTRLCSWFRSTGGVTGYVVGYEANHYETTDGQHARYPEYFERRVAEGGPA